MSFNDQTQINLPGLTKINKILILSIALIFVIQSVLSKMIGINLSMILGLSAATFFKGFIYQLISYPFLSNGLMEVIFNGLILWFIGSELEHNWGSKRYLSFMLTASMGAGIVYLLVSFIFFSESAIYSFSLIGLQGVTNALCLAYAIIYPNRTFLFMLIFPMKAKYFCGLLILIQLYMGIVENHSLNGVLAWGHLAAMGFGFFYLLTITSKSYKDLLNKMKKRKSSAKLTVLYGEKKTDETPPKYWQ